MDREGVPDEVREVGLNSQEILRSRGIHHDPLNEHYEETWSALGEQDIEEREGTEGASTRVPLPPPLTSPNSSQINKSVRPSEEFKNKLSNVKSKHKSNLSGARSSHENFGEEYSSSESGNQFLTEEIPHISDESCVKGLSQIKLELNFTPSSNLEVGLVAEPTTVYRRLIFSQEDMMKPSTVQNLTTKSSPSLFQSVSSSKSSIGVSGRSGSLFCRICHEGGFNEHFISPCCCRGSLSRVHKCCLERWLAESDSSHCELCGYKYRTKRIPKYGLISSIYAWLTSPSTSRDRRNLLIDLVALLIISPIIGLSTILALQLADSLFIIDTLEKLEHQEAVRNAPNRPDNADINPKHTLEMIGTMISRLGQMGIISMVITMDMAYISWVAMRLQSHVTKWYTWYRRNCKVTLVGYPETTVQRDLTITSSVSVHEISF